MDKRKILFCCLLSITVILSGCAKKESSSIANTASDAKPAAQTEEKANMSTGMAMDSASQNSAVDQDKSLGDTAVTKDQKIIRNGTIYIVEESLTKLSDSMQKKAKELGGYIESESLTEYNLSTRVRIPANKFDEFIKYAEDGYDVKNKSIGSENITDSYVDNEARLNNLKAQEKQILSILEKAKTVEEVLKVQSELYRIRGEAESLEARKKSWDKQVEYATLIINADKKEIVADNKKSIISGSDFFKAIGKGFSNTGISLILFIQQLLIFVFSNIIVLAIIAVLGLFGYKRFKKYYTGPKN